MAEHTPGPWMVHQYLAQTPHCKVLDVGPSGLAVCTVHGEFERPDPGSRARANAALIAAAPELLAALREIADAGACYRKDAANAVDRINLIARAAIAKAEGRE